jgi:hypothetical protein
MSLAAARSLSLSKPLSRLVVPPQRVAHALDWNRDSGNLLSLSISKDRIEIAAAAHPFNEIEIRDLPAIRLETELGAKTRTIKPHVRSELSELLGEWAVCGLIVHWPVQKDGGWCGAPCGQVLFVLDQLATSKALASRPLCLWDEQDCQRNCDSWGRSPIYARGAKQKTHHVASQEQYLSRSVALKDLWNDFRQFHWPELNPPVARTSSPREPVEESSIRPSPPQRITRSASWMIASDSGTAYPKATPVSFACL